MTDAEFNAWLFTPLSLRDLLRIELAEAARQYAIIEATDVADELMAETDARQVWRQVQADVDLTVLAEAAPNPYPERARRRG
jgi:hypothetical protein